MIAKLRELGFDSTRPRSSAGRRRASRSAATYRDRGVRASGQPGAARGRGPDRHDRRRSSPTSSRAPRVRRADDPDGRGRDRRHPCRRGCGRVGPSRSGTSRTRGSAATIDRYVGYGLDGIEAFYVAHTPEQTALVADRAEDGLAHDRLGRLPRPRPPALLEVPRLRPVRPRAAARVDRHPLPVAALASSRHERLRGHRPRPRPGADRVPADLLERAPAHRVGASSAGTTPAPTSPRSSSSGRWPRCSSTSGATCGTSRARWLRELRLPYAKRSHEAQPRRSSSSARSRSRSSASSSRPDRDRARATST